MDFHGMKRKKLQALCKKHGIPANLKNKEMADRLSFIFKGKEIEDPVSCQLNSDNAGTKKNTLHCASGKDILNVEMIDLVSPSQGLEERSDFSAKVLRSSEIERLEFKTNLSPEITREDFGICGVEEDMKSGLNKEQVGNSQEGLHSATGEVALEEFGNHLVEGEGEVEMLGDQTNLPEDVCETGKAGTETEKQEDNANNPEGSNRNYMNLSLVSQISLSPASERMIGFSPKMLNNSETEVLQSETNFSPETLKFDIEICDVKENIQIDVNKEQVGDSQEVVHAAPNVTAISDEDLEQVPSEEFGDHPMEGEVEKLGDKNNLEDVCENGKGRDEVVERGDHNSPQGSNMKDVNVIHVSQEEFGYPLVEEAQKFGDNIYNGGVYNLGNNGSEVEAKDTDGKTNLSPEHFADDVPSSSLNKYSDGTPDQFQRTSPENEVKSSGLNIHQDTCEEELKSPQKTGSIADPEECIGLSPNHLEASVIKGFQTDTYFDPSTLGDVVGTCNLEESMQSDKEEKVEYSQEALHTAANVNLLHLEQGEVTWLFDNSDVLDDAGGYGGKDDTSSPQDSNRIDLNLLQVSHEEFGNPLVEEVHKLDDYVCVCEAAVYNDRNGRTEVNTRCLDNSIGAINNDGKTNVTVEQFIDEVHSSTFEDSDGTPVQFLPNDALSEVKNDINIHEMVFSDTSEAKFASSRKISLSPTSKRMIEFFPKQLNNSETKVLQSETIFFPETQRVDIGICDVEENMQIDVNKEQVDDDNQQVIHAASSVMVMNNEDLAQVASVEVGDHLLEEEVEKSGLIADSEECIGFLPNNLEPSATKGFHAETYFDPNTLGDVVATCNMEESMQSDQMEDEYSQEVLHMANELVLLQKSMEESNSVQGEVTRLFDNSDVHEDAGGTGAEEDQSQHNVKRDMDSIEKHLLNGFQTIDDASDQNSDEKPDECSPTMPQPGEMKSCSFNLQQISVSGTVSGDEGTFQEKLETPAKCTPIASPKDSIMFHPKLLESSMKKELKIVSSLPVKRVRDVLGTSDMKENIKIAKKEQVGTIMSKSAFPKRQPLQDLQQN